MRDRMTVMVLFIFHAFLWYAGANSAEPQNEGHWKPLFNGKDLTGWEIVGTGNWRVEDGELVVSRIPGEEHIMGWLVTEKDYSDFKLRLKMKMLSETNSGILIRDPAHGKISRPAFNGYEIQMARIRDREGKLYESFGGIYALANAFSEPLIPENWNTIEVHCIGDHIVSYINGKKMAETHSRQSYKGGIGLQLHQGREKAHLRWKDIEIMELPKAPRPFQYMEEAAEQAPGEYRDLLAGRKIEEFDVHWGGAEWSLQDGILRGANPKNRPSWIFTKESYSDFILAFEYRIPKAGNAGVGFRFPWPGPGVDKMTHRPAMEGFQMKILDPEAAPEELGRTSPEEQTGSFYGLARALTRDAWGKAISWPEKWNTVRIFANGDHIVIYVNNRKTSEVHSDRIFNGRIGFQAHSPGEWVEFRNLRIKTLK